MRAGLLALAVLVLGWLLLGIGAAIALAVLVAAVLAVLKR